MKFLGFLICIFLALPAHAQSFFNTLPDVPLMAGLSELEGEALSFDKPEGRILVGVAMVDDSLAIKDVQTYYQRTLPQFGWRAVNANNYVRGDEALEISVPDYDSNNGANRILEFTISP